MSKKMRFVVLVTTDGTRSEAFARFLRSVSGVDGLALFVLLQCCTEMTEEMRIACPKTTIWLKENRRVPLSVARNSLLESIEVHSGEIGICDDTWLLLGDDDCWYPDGFFEKFKPSGDIRLCSAVDPTCNRSFSTLQLAKRAYSGALRRWEVMFYAVSISLAFRYSLVKGMQFKPNIGLGNEISQGEESLFLLSLMKKFPRLQLIADSDLSVYHPWKFATNSNNHRSLGYFLGWVSARGHVSVVPYFLYSVAKYAVATLIKPRLLYWDIFSGLCSSFIKGVFDTKNLGKIND